MPEATNKTTKARHPCAGMTKAQLNAFEALAVGSAPMATSATIKALICKGVVIQGVDRVVGRDAFGLIRVPTYDVPLSTHMQWCRWCDENVGEADHD